MRQFPISMTLFRSSRNYLPILNLSRSQEVSSFYRLQNLHTSRDYPLIGLTQMQKHSYARSLRKWVWVMKYRHLRIKRLSRSAGGAHQEGEGGARTGTGAKCMDMSGKEQGRLKTVSYTH